jgi:hypothetical protein
MNQNPNKLPKPSAQRARISREGDDADYCRAKAHDLIEAAIDKPIGNERALLERSAAGWAMRAEQLHRSDARLFAELPEHGSEVGHVRL